ncbi:MAG: aminodeoxychorismate lyase [Thiobacillus sp.]|nr:aminodeoxychorismate lyase [Thiobacillus sp.]
MMLVNGRPAETIDARDRGLAYGDGVFRTLRVEAGEPLWWRDHAAKLAADCAALALACPDPQALLAEVNAVAGQGDCVVKLIVTRGTGARGYAPPEGPVTRIVMAAPVPAHGLPGAPTDIAARTCTLRLARQPRLAGVKHLNRLENVLARAEWRDPEIFEGLLCDDTGMLVGGTMSNLLWMKDGELRTPDQSASGVAGVALARLLRAAPRLGIPARFERQPPAAILDADEIMICNSLIGVRRVAQLDGTVLPDAGWRARLNDALYENLD